VRAPARDRCVCASQLLDCRRDARCSCDSGWLPLRCECTVVRATPFRHTETTLSHVLHSTALCCAGLGDVAAAAKPSAAQTSKQALVLKENGSFSK